MSQLSKVGAFLAAIAFIDLGSVGAARALSHSHVAPPNFTFAVEQAKAPPGWAEFCAHYIAECKEGSDKPFKLALTVDAWEKMVAVNNWANHHIKPTSDKAHWGRPNKWYFAEDGRGDCKDYVLVKQKMLAELNFPREALLIAIVWTQESQGHAVLIVRTDKGDYVLDNLSRKIKPWYRTGYDFVMRQAQSNPNLWVYIDGPPNKRDAVLDEDPGTQPILSLDATAMRPTRQVMNPTGSSEDPAPGSRVANASSALPESDMAQND